MSGPIERHRTIPSRGNVRSGESVETAAALPASEGRAATVAVAGSGASVYVLSDFRQPEPSGSSLAASAARFREMPTRPIDQGRHDRAIAMARAWMEMAFRRDIPGTEAQRPQPSKIR